MSTDWRKVKHSTSFRRIVSRNYLKLLSMPYESSHSVPVIIRSTSSGIVTPAIIIQKENYQNLLPQNVSNLMRGSPSREVVHEGHLVASNGEEDLAASNWLDELDNIDDDDERIHTDSSSDDKLRNNLKSWANKFNIRQSALSALCRIFNERLPNILPSDARTLLRTPQSILLRQIGDGNQLYWHQGIEFCLRNCFRNIPRLSCISININIDGIPIYRSAKDEFWPILFNIHEVPQIQPMVIGIYHGTGKPSDLKSFITPFVEEAKSILLHGIDFGDHKMIVRIRCFICDSPARAFIKGVANFNSQNGCLKCTTVGEYSYVTHCNVFPRTQCPKRTDEAFRAKIYESHHKQYTPLEELPINMIQDFPIGDSLHLIDLGIMKRCLLGWRDGTFRKFRMKWSARDIQNISKRLVNYKMPSELHRAVRGLDCLAHWKGLEYRSFLYYIGIVVLKYNVPYDIYEHFLIFFCAITMCSSKFYSFYLDIADAMLEAYIEKYRELYGEEYMTSNVHNLSHLVDEVRNFGILSTFNAYPFENKLYLIKNMLRSGKNPLCQVAKRIMEQSQVENKTIPSNRKFPTLKKPNLGPEIRGDYLETQRTNFKFFYKVELDDFMLSTTQQDRWFLTNQDEIVCMKNAVVRDGIVSIFGSSLKKISDFFETPVKSSFLNIYESDCQENEGKLYNLHHIKCKLVAIEYDNETVVFIPLLHTL